jgi:hypothetical protein
MIAAVPYRIKKMPRKVVVVQCPLEDDETIQDLCSVRDLRPRNRSRLIFAMVSRYRFTYSVAEP